MKATHIGKLIALALLAPWPVVAAADGPCSTTADEVFAACGAGATEDFLLANARCTNVPGAGPRAACRDDATLERDDAEALCGAQRDARKQVCGLVGEARYAPDFSPARFVHPDEIGGGVPPNPFFPIVQGYRWVYEGAGEHVVVKVTGQTKLIEGVTCRVITDDVFKHGKLHETTVDWVAQDVDGAVWYCGEATLELETFPGDRPRIPEVVSIEGTFKVGRDGDKPGILMPAVPQPGVTHREEFSLDNAEDLAEVLSVTGTESVPAATCDGTCVVTRNFTPATPGVDETKFYAPGVGAILTIDPDGARAELVEFTTE